MVTRFYLDRPTAPSISPAVDAGWNVSGTLLRRILTPASTATVLSALATSGGTFTTPATSQSVVGYQFVGPPLDPQPIAGTISMAMFVSEGTGTANATLATVVRVLSNDGTTVRGTLFSVFGTDVEFDIFNATRIVNAQAVTPVTAQSGDRIVVEMGVQLTAGAVNTFSYGNGFSGGADYALTTGQTTSLNPWVEFSQTLLFGLGQLPVNYQAAKVGDGMSVGERIR